MYIPDGSEVDYDSPSNPGGPNPCNVDQRADFHSYHDNWRNRQTVPGRYSFGWLGNFVPEGKLGWPDARLKELFLERLDELTRDCVVKAHRGFHDCEICGRDKSDRWRWNGSFLIRYEGLEFRCPAAVGHYVEVHDYYPGKSAVFAVFKGTPKTADREGWEIEAGMEKHFAKCRFENAKREWERVEGMTIETLASELERKNAAQKFDERCQNKLRQLRRSGAIVRI